MVTSKQWATPDFARKLFTRGTDFFGPEEVRRAYEINLGDTVPPIPFSEDELKRARELGQYLVLIASYDAKGQPLSLSGLYDALGNEIGEGKLLFDNGWYAKESFYSEPIASTPTWKLVSREIIPDSASETYRGQTSVMARYLLDQVYGGMEMPALYQAAIDEFEKQEDDLSKLMKSDWKAAAEKLAALQLNQLFRETPGEVMYRLGMYLKVNGEYLLPEMYTWTKTRSSDGRLVPGGGFDSVGAYVGHDYPGFSDSALGVCFSRSAVPES